MLDMNHYEIHRPKYPLPIGTFKDQKNYREREYPSMVNERRMRNIQRPIHTPYTPLEKVGI